MGLSLLAVWFAERPATPEKTYGYYRVEILAALLNGVVLCVLALVILFEAWERLRTPHEVLAGPVLVVAVAALGVNLFAARLLHAGAGESLNVRSAYLEVLGDALSSAAVIAAAGIILLTGWTTADALASAAIGLLILPRTVSLLRQAVNVLLEGVPPHLDLGQIDGARGHERPCRGRARHAGRQDPRGASRHPARPLRHRSHHAPDRDRDAFAPADLSARLGSPPTRPKQRGGGRERPRCEAAPEGRR